MSSNSVLIKQIVNHSYDYRPNWTPLSPVTITTTTTTTTTTNNNNNNNNSIIIINFIQVLCNFSMVLLIGDTNRLERMSYSLLKQANCMRNYNIHTDGVNSR